MKKLLAILMILALIFAFTVSVSAAKSPEPVIKHSVTVISHEDGTASGKSITYSVNDGESIVVNVPESVYTFTNAVVYKDDRSTAVSGTDYTIVSGGLSEKTLTIKPLTDIIVEQYFSGENIKYEDTYNIEINTSGGKFSRFVGKNGLLTVKAESKDFNSFRVYLSDGKTLAKLGIDYKLVESELDDGEIQIIALTDIVIAEVTNEDVAKESAKTGVPILAISLTIIAAAVACVVAKKRAF